MEQYDNSYNYNDDIYSNQQKQNIANAGINYIKSKYKDKSIPLQLLFLFSGEADTESRIIRSVLQEGYTISRIWIVDRNYNDESDYNPVLKRIKNAGFTNIFSMFHTHFNIRINGYQKKQDYETNKNKYITNMFKCLGADNDNIVNVIILKSFETLHTLINEYVLPSENIIAIAIHPQVQVKEIYIPGTRLLDEEAIKQSMIEHKSIIGNFYKMFINKFNIPILFFWEQKPYIYIFNNFEKIKDKDSFEVYEIINDIYMKKSQDGGKSYYKYKGYSYKIRIGKQGGKYILIKGIKKYIK